MLLVDLAAMLSSDDLALACHDAEVRHTWGDVFEERPQVLRELRSLLRPSG